MTRPVATAVMGIAEQISRDKIHKKHSRLQLKQCAQELQTGRETQQPRKQRGIGDGVSFKSPHNIHYLHSISYNSEAIPTMANNQEQTRPG